MSQRLVLAKSRRLHLEGCPPSRIVLTVDPSETLPYATHHEVYRFDDDSYLDYTERFEKLEEALGNFATRAWHNIRRAEHENVLSVA